MEMNLKIDPEFQSKIPPLTAAEYKQLEENILETGKVYEPIAIWNGTIVDGHNRYKIALEHPEIEWSVRELHFADKWEAFDWMYKNQLGRRNLTDAQKTYLLGKLYEARKHTVGEHKGNQYTKLERMQNECLPNGRTKRVYDYIAEEQGVNSSTVQRAEHYAHGIDAIRDEAPEMAESILTGDKKIPKMVIQEIGKTTSEDRKPLINSVVAGINTSGPRDRTGSTRENRTFKKEINTIIESMSDNTPMDYTIDNLTEQISCNADSFVGMISNLIMDHRDVCNENMDKVVEAISGIIEKIEKIKERLSDGAQL